MSCTRSKRSDFATKYKIEIIQVVESKDFEKLKTEKAFTGDGSIINSKFLNGLTITEAKEKIVKEIEKRKLEIRK